VSGSLARTRLGLRLEGSAVVRPQRSDLEFLVGAGEGNRTLMTSLEGWGSTIELRPRGDCARTSAGETVCG
jgi:hypothetical protein